MQNNTRILIQSCSMGNMDKYSMSNTENPHHILVLTWVTRAAQSNYINHRVSPMSVIKTPKFFFLISNIWATQHFSFRICNSFSCHHFVWHFSHLRSIRIPFPRFSPQLPGSWRHLTNSLVAFSPFFPNKLGTDIIILSDFTDLIC